MEISRDMDYFRFKSRTKLLFSAVIVSAAYTVLQGVFSLYTDFSTGYLPEVLHSVAIAGFIISLVYLSVTFFIWVYSFFKSLELLGLNTPCSPWIAVIWFFVPIFNLFKPYMIFRKIKLTLDNESDENSTLFILKVWWGLFLISGIISKIAFRLLYSTSTVNDLIISDYFNLASVAVNLVYTVVLLLFISDFWNKYNSIRKLKIADNTDGDRLK